MKKFIAFLVSVMMVTALAVPVFAEGAYMESITAKPAPEVVGDGGVIGDVIDNGNDVGDITEGEIIITPLSEKDGLEDKARTNLEEAFGRIRSGGGNYPKEMEEILGENPVAKDLFDVEVVGESLLEDLANGKEIRFTLNVGIGAGEPVVVVTYVDDEWIMATETINNGDGTITVTLSKLGAIGVFVKGEGTTEPNEPVGSEPVGEGNCRICHTFFPYLGAAPIVDGVCIICFVLVVTVVGTGAYIVYRNAKKGKDEKKS